MAGLPFVWYMTHDNLSAKALVTWWDYWHFCMWTHNSSDRAAFLFILHAEIGHDRVSLQEVVCI